MIKVSDFFTSISIKASQITILITNLRNFYHFIERKLGFLTSALLPEMVMMSCLNKTGS